MFTLDKIRFSINRLIFNLVFSFLFWVFAWFLFIYFTDGYRLFDNLLKIESSDASFFTLLFVSLFTALFFSITDWFWGYRVIRFFPIQVTQVLKFVLYILFGFLILMFLFNNHLNNISIDNLVITKQTRLSFTDIEIKTLVFFYLAVIANGFLSAFIKKIGRGNLRRWFFGLLNKPTEEERIFMFVDLKSSTTIAEKLMHKKFSHLVQDLFNDMAVVENYGGEIYQYLGDGAVITWNVQRGLYRNNALKSYFAFINVLQKRKRYYYRKYKVEPQFKAGVHIGKVMVLQVGQLKRDISYNGDTINTAARIESKCNELNQQLLVSHDLFIKANKPQTFAFKDAGVIDLRGKRTAVRLYGVKLK